MTAVLLVTWITAYGLSSYQIAFDTLEKCSAAAEALQASATKMVNPTHFLDVSTVCVRK